MSQSETDVPVCPKCAGTGWVRIRRDEKDGVIRCECRKAGRPERLLELARIPARYKHCELREFVLNAKEGLTNQSHERAKLVAEKFVDEYPASMPFGLLFMGPPGVGKTHLAVGIVRELINRKGIPCLFRSFPELLKEIQNSYSAISQSSELALLSPVLDTEVLVLDELGSQNFTSWVRDTVSYVINYRYAESKVTIFTTNLLDRKKDDPQDIRKGIPDALVDRIGEQMRSRLFEMCKTVVISGNVDFRQAVKQAEHHF